MESTTKNLKVSTAKLKLLNEGQSLIVTEKQTDYPGSIVQSLGRVCCFKLTTEKCFVISLHPKALIDVVIVTRPTIPLEDIPLATRLKVSVSRLKTLKMGESCIFTELKHKHIGTVSQGYASRAGIKITTEKCFVLVPITLETLNALIVTRVEGDK